MWTCDGPQQERPPNCGEHSITKRRPDAERNAHGQGKRHEERRTGPSDDALIDPHQESDRKSEFDDRLHDSNCWNERFRHVTVKLRYELQEMGPIAPRHARGSRWPVQAEAISDCG